jgi:transcriptional regulator with XRE-family HTH domain
LFDPFGWIEGESTMPGFTYKSYSFMDKDPIIDEIRTIYQDSGVNYKWISDNSGVSAATLTAWFSGTTKKPQAATINAVLRALGYKLGIVEFGREQVHIIPTMPQPLVKHSSMRHVVQMKKYKRK